MEDFIEALPVDDRASVRARIDFLAEIGNRAREPLPKSLGSGLFELRVKASRIFYCFKPGGRIVLLHGFIKKSQKTPRGEMQLALNGWRKFDMKKKRTATYRFGISAESAKFRRAYYDELGRLRLAHRIAELRERCGLTQAQLADKVGTTQAGISRLENPNYRNYSLTTLEKVAAALGVRLRVELEETSKAA